MKQSDERRLKKILDYSVKLNQYLEANHMQRTAVMDDETIQWTLTTPLYNIGEHVYCLSGEFKDAHPDVPWNMIAGLRHRLVHNYEGTNWSIIVDVVFDELPIFTKQIKGILEEES